MKAQHKKYDITQCALYKCQSKKRLERILLLDEGKLKFLENIIHYHKFQMDKKDGGKRDITAPNRQLKQLQKRVLHLLQHIERPEWLISGEKGKWYIDNGKAHLSSTYMLTMDIRKFYDNCKREPVYKFFRNKLSTATDIAQILTDIVTYDGGIPTGCPTSQLISFYAYEAMFEEIRIIANHLG